MTQVQQQPQNHTAHEPSDADLVCRVLRAGDDATGAFGALIRRHQPRVYGYLLRRVPSRADAEDLAQETFLRAWERLNFFNPQRCFRTWVFTIASRLLIDHRRARSAAAARERAHRGVPHDPASVAACGGESPSDVWSLAQRVLTDEQFDAVWLRYVEDLQPAQIARVLGRSRVGVRVLLLRARERLAEHLESEAEPADGRRSRRPESPHRSAKEPVQC